MIEPPREPEARKLHFRPRDLARSAGSRGFSGSVGGSALGRRKHGFMPQRLSHLEELSTG
jgi:hypothetical protein